MTLPVVYMPTRNSSEGLQFGHQLSGKIEECFMVLSGNFKAWLDYFILYAENEGGGGS